MTLSDMATLISTELGVYDTTSLSLIKSYLSKEYISLWDKYPWNDTRNYASTDAAPGVSIIPYPAGMDRIITIRASTAGTSPPPGFPGSPTTELPVPIPPTFTTLDSRFIDEVDVDFLMETDPTIFEAYGYVKYYQDIGVSFGGGTRQIRLFPIPDWGTTLLFYGKTICPGLINDTDIPQIRNIVPVLLDYATADMLRRQRQYGKADIKTKEAQGREQEVWNLEQQQSNQPRKSKNTTVAGNSLAEMTDAVCTICGQWTPEYRLIIREFLRRNYQALYDTYLWPESLVVVQVPFSTEQIVMPPYIDKVLGVRGVLKERLSPMDAELFLDVSPDQFDNLGVPAGYTTLTPVAVSTLPATTTQLVFASTQMADRTRIAIRGEILATGQELEETVILNGVTPVTSQYSYDIPLTIAKDITLGDVTVNAASDYTSLQVLLSYVRELKHQRLWLLPPPDPSSLASNMPPTNGPAVGPPWVCLVLGKRAIRPLLTDQDTPIITGAQQVLIAAAAGDLFRKLEKADMATALLAKASASTDVLKAKNLDQAASAPRFVPQVEPLAYVPGLGGFARW